MDYLTLYRKMRECDLISDQWEFLSDAVAEELKDDEKELYMPLFLAYFSLIDDGNVYMSLERDTLAKKFAGKIEKQKVRFEEDAGKQKGDILKDVSEKLNESFDSLSGLKSCSVVGENTLFVIEDGKLFTSKFHSAVKEIGESFKRLFGDGATYGDEEIDFDLDDSVSGDMRLTDGQKEIVKKGLRNNLLVSGGPGTGKTTSIFFLLIALLRKHKDHQIYLAAPSGKAASRMKESIMKCAEHVDRERFPEEIDLIEGLNEYTIHRLLGSDYENGGFKHDKKNRFDETSIFVIDEASMIDVCVFASLLEAIPDKARVFILGDKNQLPSVECGAVFGDLLKMADDQNKAELVESKRFPQGSHIDVLARAINAGDPLPEKICNAEKWKSWDRFEIITDDGGKEYPIYLYSDDAANQTEMISDIVGKWFSVFYPSLAEKCEKAEPEEEQLGEIVEIAENARILCAANEGVRGAKSINRFILKKFFVGGESVSGFYPGEVLMITKNLRLLDLYNGDCGVAVKMKNESGDDGLYIMFRKQTSLPLDEERRNDRVFRKGEYVFYPARLIGNENVAPAFAITIHKSQGSDYPNVLVILPKNAEHPLLNRQIVYTAITRTKGSTYILSNRENLGAAKDNVLTRETGIKHA